MLPELKPGLAELCGLGLGPAGGWPGRFSSVYTRRLLKEQISTGGFRDAEQ